MSAPTPLPWFHAADSYGKVRHSRKACVAAVVKGPGGERIVSIAARIENWEDARLIETAVNHHAKLVAMLRHLGDALNMSDPDHADFADSGADVVELLWTKADEARELLAALDGTPVPDPDMRGCGVDADHDKDADCDVDPATDSCRGCGVYHGGPPCPECGQRALHATGCSEIG